MRYAAMMAALAMPAMGQFADFEGDFEGFHGDTFTTGGITFFDCNNVNGFYPDGQPFDPDELGTQYIVERSVPLFNDFPGAGSPFNALTFGTSFIGGDNLTIGPLAMAHFTAPGVFNHARFDLFFYENGPWGGIEVVIEAVRNTQVVGSQSFIVAGDDPQARDNPAHREIVLDGVNFDTVRVFARNADGFTTIRGMFDDVAMRPVPGPAGILALAGALGLASRRRR